jgi:hypothetical protein
MLKQRGIFPDGSRVLCGDGEAAYWIAVSGGKPKPSSLSFLNGWGIEWTGYSPIREPILLISLLTGKSGTDELLEWQ